MLAILRQAQPEVALAPPSAALSSLHDAACSGALVLILVLVLWLEFFSQFAERTFAAHPTRHTYTSSLDSTTINELQRSRIC